jgi:hypothetical protein
MRIWDIDPGYLTRQSLLGEHRELHGIVSIIADRKKGYSRHPETLRWKGHDWALGQRHRQLIFEMALRGFVDRTPVAVCSNEGIWPETYIDEPGRQFRLLKIKYEDRKQGRIPLPKNVQQLWSQHKYSVLARSPNIYRQIGRDAADMKYGFDDLAMLLTGLLRQRPEEGGIRNAVQHMWGYFSSESLRDKENINSWPLRRLLQETQRRAMAAGDSYIVSSTALGELMAWLPDED